VSYEPGTQTPTVETMRGLPAPDILDLVDLGLSIIPIERGTKRPPKGFQWRPYQDKAATREQVQTWQRAYPGCSWAAVWGEASGGVIAVDIDNPVAFGRCQQQGGFNQSWPVWYATGRGWQYLFKVPVGLTDVRGVNPFPGVELRCNGQYSVIPPSIHPSGKVYEWRRFGRIPYAPQWIIDHLTGVATQETATSATPQQVHSITRRHYGGQRPHDITGRNPRILKSPGYRWLWETTFGPHHHHDPFFALAILMRGAGFSEDEARRKSDQWRYKCTRPVYDEREAHAVIKATYRHPYGVTVANLHKAIDIHGQRMTEMNALDLYRLFPNVRRRRGERIHDPLFVSVGRILEVLYKQRVMKPTAIPHRKMAELTGLTESRVTKVVDFLAEIGVRTTTRQGRSTISTYSLKGLNTPSRQLIKHLARWRGYAVPWRVLASRLWRRVHSLMRAVLSHLNDVFNWLSATWQGETTRTAIGFPVVALEGVLGRGPPN